MIKIAYRESESFIFEHVAYVDGVNLKLNEGELFVLDLVGFEPQPIPNGEPVLQPIHKWTKVEGPWQVESHDRDPGVYEIPIQ